MNARNNIFLIVIILCVICIILYKQTEGWIPWVWNIPTRDIYPPLYYDLRCQPPVHHYYRRTYCPVSEKIKIIKPVRLCSGCPYDF